MSSRHPPIWFVLLAALVLRVAVALLAMTCNEDSSVFFEPYSPQYLKPAMSLVSSDGFAVDGHPELRRTPGYPMLLVPGIVLHNVALVTIVLQLLLSCLTVYLVYRIGLLLFGQSDIAAWCSLLYAIEPLSVIFTSLIMPETALTCAVCAFFFYLLQYIHGGSMRHLVASAGAAAACAYISPVTLYLPFVIVLAGVIHALMKRKKALLTPALVFLGLYVGLIGPWVIRNKVEAGFCGFSTIFPNSMYYSVAGSVEAELDGKPIEDVQRELGHRLSVYSEHHPEPSEQYSFMRREGLRAVISEPCTYASIHLKGMVRTLVGLAAHGYVRLLCVLPSSGGLRTQVLMGDGLMRIAISRWRELPFAVVLVTGALEMMAIIVYSLALVGLFSRRVLGTAEGTVLLISALYILVVTGGFHGYSRYRHPITPVVAILAGYGFCLLLERWKGRRKPSHL